MIGIRFLAPEATWGDYAEPLSDALQRAGLAATVSPELAPDRADYIVYAPGDQVPDFGRFPRLKAVLSLWAGVEKIVTNPTLKVPLTRMVDDGLRDGMVEWVLGHTLRHHLGMDRHILNPENRWSPHTAPLAAERCVTVLGLGALGQAAAKALRQVGFNVHGWSRRQKSIPDITCHSGEAGLTTALSMAQTLVLLLPDTAETQNILNHRTLGLLPKGAVLLNPGRGTLIDDNALLEAFQSGQVAHATLDVFRTEPLPPDHPFWSTPNVTVTPHIAAETRPGSASAVIAENIRRSEAGMDLLHLVDRTAGY